MPGNKKENAIILFQKKIRTSDWGDTSIQIIVELDPSTPYPSQVEKESFRTLHSDRSSTTYSQLIQCKWDQEETNKVVSGNFNFKFSNKYNHDSPGKLVSYFLEEKWSNAISRYFVSPACGSRAAQVNTINCLPINPFVVMFLVNSAKNLTVNDSIDHFDGNIEAFYNKQLYLLNVITNILALKGMPSDIIRNILSIYDIKLDDLKGLYSINIKEENSRPSPHTTRLFGNDERHEQPQDDNRATAYDSNALLLEAVDTVERSRVEHEVSPPQPLEGNTPSSLVRHLECCAVM